MNFARIALATAVLALSSAAANAIDISGAGATFPYPIYAKWADAYKKETGNGLNYQSIGSGGGIRQLSEGTVDFGAPNLMIGAGFAGAYRASASSNWRTSATNLLIAQNPNIAIGTIGDDGEEDVLPLHLATRVAFQPRASSSSITLPGPSRWPTPTTTNRPPLAACSSMIAARSSIGSPRDCSTTTRPARRSSPPPPSA